ncbi:hypothetical protein SD77_0551 [Bacillus badius]|uniref:Uncharacterized protein n=1 Tax=Bacillus badius TaxID=1455 RepID=A0ABR5B2I4_BACBA|nr:hypothetical protein SD77_0551 [Bacillus badius]
MNICLKSSFLNTKKICPEMADSQAINMTYIGLTHAIAHIGSHDDLVTLSKQYEELINIYVLKKGAS